MSSLQGSSSLRSTRPSRTIAPSEPGPRTCRSAVARRMASAATGFATEAAAPQSGPLAGSTDSHVKRTASVFPVSTGVIGPVYRMRSVRGRTPRHTILIRAAFLTQMSPAVASAEAGLLPSRRRSLEETCTPGATLPPWVACIGAPPTRCRRDIFLFGLVTTLLPRPECRRGS